MQVQVPIPTPKKPTYWFIRLWRPAMAWQYLVVCLFDFVIAPILWTGYQGLMHESLTQWTPLTLQNGGFYHLTMGPIVGVYTWQRTKEKIAMITNAIKGDPENVHEERPAKSDTK